MDGAREAAGVVMDSVHHGGGEGAVAHEPRVGQSRMDVVAALLRVEWLQHDDVHPLGIAGRDAESTGLRGDEQSEIDASPLLGESE